MTFAITRPAGGSGAGVPGDLLGKRAKLCDLQYLHPGLRQPLAQLFPSGIDGDPRLCDQHINVLARR